MKYIFLLFFVSMLACQQPVADKSFPSPSVPPSPKEEATISLSREEYYDKVLGMLVGSAIGDAMGAPTEMWDRKAIDIQKGYVDSLDAVIRERSPEGPWETNMLAGSTTDDTRWKYLGIHYLLTQSQDSLNPHDFAKHIIEVYQSKISEVGKTEEYENINRVFAQSTWLIEWVKVAKPFMNKDLNDYNEKLSRFYGGEMSCAGLLYTPVVGAYFPGNPAMSYNQAYGLTMFDIGYARDISALTAAYVSKAMERGVEYNEITLLTRDLDPQGYFNSRLIGRMAFKAYENARYISHEAYSLTEKDIPIDLRLPQNFKHDALYYMQLQKAYSLLEKHVQDIPFHAAEIHQINLAALEFSKGDFKKAIEFVTNFGRDNDTVGAVTGAILGAYWGVQKLPPDMVASVLKVNKETVGLDLEKLAEQLVEHRMGQH
jgi:ADP-ribosylglycohydrolase